MQFCYGWPGPSTQPALAVACEIWASDCKQQDCMQRAAVALDWLQEIVQCGMYTFSAGLSTVWLFRNTQEHVSTCTCKLTLLTCSLYTVYLACLVGHAPSFLRYSVLQIFPTFRSDGAKSENQVFCRITSPGMWRSVGLVWIDVSKERVSSILWVGRITQPGTTLAVTSKLLTFFLICWFLQPWRWRKCIHQIRQY
jgi:hypothetical protein